MSAVIKLSSKLPGDDETNGLDALHEQIVANPDQVICALVWITVPKITRVVELKADVPTVEIRRIEPISTVDRTPSSVQSLAAEPPSTGARRSLTGSSVSRRWRRRKPS